MLTDIKSTLAFITGIMTDEVIPYFDATHAYSVSDMSSILSKFLVVQQSLFSLNDTLDSTVLAVEQKINDFNASSGGSSSVTGSYRNLKVSSTGLDANVTVTCDELVVSNASGYKTLKNINLTFSALDTGALTVSTWYAVHIASDGTNVIGILSLSAAAPTLPTGYTFFARVGWIRTDGAISTKYPLAFVQYGNIVQYKIAPSTNLATPRLMASGTVGNVATPTWASVSVSQYVPPTAKIINVNAFSPNSGACMFAPNNASGAYTSTSNPPPFYGNPSYSEINGRIVLESTNIYVACSVACYFFCSGWEDNI